jgi:hypothetical protein
MFPSLMTEMSNSNATKLRLATAVQMEKMVIDGVRNIESIRIPMVFYFYFFSLKISWVSNRTVGFALFPIFFQLFMPFAYYMAYRKSHSLPLSVFFSFEILCPAFSYLPLL